MGYGGGNNTFTKADYISNDNAIMSLDNVYGLFNSINLVF